MSVGAHPKVYAASKRPRAFSRPCERSWGPCELSVEACSGRLVVGGSQSSPSRPGQLGDVPRGFVEWFGFPAARVFDV